MSIMLINVIGFSLCAGVVAVNTIALYKETQKEKEDAFNEVSPESINLNAEVLGLSVEMVRWGLEFVDSKTDAIFDNPTVKKLSWKIIKPFQIEPDGHYLKSPAQAAWNGYETKEDVPVYRLGKFEMYI